MNLKSCDNCGIVIDENKISLFPDGTIDDCGIWDGEDHYKYWICPSCKEKNISSCKVDI